MPYQPPFTITTKIIHLISTISEQIGIIDGARLQASPQLRKQNHIKTITGTLAIEGNTLNLEQVTAILEGKPVLGEPREIAEVQGAIRTYENLANWRSYSVSDLLAAHKMMMANILVNAGHFRTSGVGIHQGDQVLHVAPPASRVSHLMTDLMQWIKDCEQHPLIVSAVFHYELEFIHPFIDGNGRMGRLWQTLILGQWKPIFYRLPLESVICEHQQNYYEVLQKSDKAADCTVFVEFMLEAIHEVLQQNTLATDQANDQVSDQVKKLLLVMDKNGLSRQELMTRLGLSHKATFRKNYLNPALALGLIEMSNPNTPRSPKQKYRKK